jgi:hypothetical protein
MASGREDGPENKEEKNEGNDKRIRLCRKTVVGVNEVPI